MAMNSHRENVLIAMRLSGKYRSKHQGHERSDSEKHCHADDDDPERIRRTLFQVECRFLRQRPRTHVCRLEGGGGCRVDTCVRDR